MPVYALFLSYPLTGHTTVLTFASRFDRAMHMLLLQPQPVVMRTQDYQEAHG
jgi:hypothetical protein